MQFATLVCSVFLRPQNHVHGHSRQVLQLVDTDPRGGKHNPPHTLLMCGLCIATSSHRGQGWKGEENSNRGVEKPDRHDLCQVIKVNTISDRSGDGRCLIGCDEKGTVPLWSPSQQPGPPVQSGKKQTNSNRGTLYNDPDPFSSKLPRSSKQEEPKEL